MPRFASIHNKKGTRMGALLLWYAQHGRHLYGESPEWGLASAYH
jgi:hypothetical protein